MKLSIFLENCYGIKRLGSATTPYIFDFSDGNKSFAIYAPNGAMKTSFAKTFYQISQKNKPKDELYDLESKFEIKTEEGEIRDDEVFVIKPYIEKYEYKNVSTLLVDEKRKEEYDTISSDILNKKKSLISNLNKLSGVKKDDIEKLISENFGATNLLEFLEKEDVNKFSDDYSDVKYLMIFNDEVLSFLNNSDVSKHINEYIEKYNELIESSPYYKKGIFNPSKAESVAKTLKNENFFKAGHSVKLNGDADAVLEVEFNKKLEESKKRIIENENLRSIEKLITSKVSIKAFQDLLESKPEILQELGFNNLSNFKKKIWRSYFKKELETIGDLLDFYKKSKNKLKEIEDEANQQTAKWHQVVDEFKKRFDVPFKIKIQNKKSAILGTEAANINFYFEDENGNEKSLKREKLDEMDILSQGERRALYILNIIFEIEVRKMSGKKTLLIIDDIADSFDYKNKYAIIEYLKEIPETENFYQIILTHNFDFFRTIQGRFIPYKKCLMVEKTPEEVKITSAEYIKNPFRYWMTNLSDDKKLIASIPFVRNLIEYTKNETDNDYLKLTSLLHIKSDSDSILKSDLQNIYNHFFPDLSLALSDGQNKVIDLIFDLADSSVLATESINLENKILLSIAIRLKAEKFMLTKIGDKSETDEKQTRKFFERFKTDFRGETETTKILEQVNLMTPENIHLNSFMYEPILDMSDRHLRNLYTNVKNLS